MKKVELHCHLEGAAPPALTQSQAERYGIDLSSHLREGRYVWHDFGSFLECFDKVSEVYKSTEDYALLAETYLAELASVGTIYSELIVSPDHGDRIGLGADAYIEGVCEGLRRAKAKFGIEARLIVTGERHFGPESVIGAALYAARSGNPLIAGFNLAGDERMLKVSDYARAFDIAREAGLGLTIHAGEVCGPFSVIDALDVVRPHRIGHGVRSIEDAELVKRLADTGVVLEVCPGSNIALGIYLDFASHPLPALLNAGVKVTINSDDPPFFHTSLATEYERAELTFGLDKATVDALTRTAIDAAFVDESTKEKLRAQLDRG
ncbi:adenosine deaminase [Rhizobium sp. ICMP 5592]|nr:adenosine deaminase [Rhizobium sp. ICMP 5592]